MKFVVSLVVVGVVIALWAKACLLLGRWNATRSARRERVETPRDWRLRERVPRPRGVALPPGHRPPPGLGPLSPSERFLTQEATRGIRELQQFLLDQHAA